MATPITGLPYIDTPTPYYPLGRVSDPASSKTRGGHLKGTPTEKGGALIWSRREVSATDASLGVYSLPNMKRKSDDKFFWGGGCLILSYLL